MMAYDSGPVVLGTGDTDIFICPAESDAAVRLTFGNKAAATRALTLKIYRAFNASTTTVCAGTVLAALTFPAFTFAVTLKPGDKLIGSSSADAVSITVTPAISYSKSSASKGYINRGAYAAGTTYAANNTVSVAGEASYVSMVDDNLGQTPSSSPAYWQVLAQRGEQGPAGVAGASSLTVVRAAAIGAVDYAVNLENGDVQDGVALATNDLVLLLSTTAPERSGIYVVQASGPALRHSDFASYDSHAGKFISVRAGTLYHDTLWFFSSDMGGTLNTTSIVAEELNRVRFDVAQTLTAAQQAQVRTNVSAALKGHIFGLTLSNNASDATNDIDIAVGEAASTETNPSLMVLATALGKRLDAAWAVGGTPAASLGGLDTGAIANGTYHVWLIQRSDTGVVDALFSLSATAPTMPANYDRKRRIGSIVRASATIKAFIQSGDEFTWAVPVGDIAAVNPGTAAVTRTLTLPIGVIFMARISVALYWAVAAEAPGAAFISNLAITDTAASTNAFNAFGYTSIAGAFITASVVEVYTNTSAQVRSRLATSGATTTLYMTTLGWFDTRGR